MRCAQGLVHFDNVIGCCVQVLTVARDQLLNVPVNVLRNGGVVVAEAGHIAPNRNSGRNAVLKRFSIDRFCGKRHRNKDVVLIFRELAVNTDADHIAVLAELSLQVSDILLIRAGAVPAGHLHAVVGLGVHGVRIVECASVLRWVSAHQ